MNESYFNFRHEVAPGSMSFSSALNRWWRLHQHDPHWVPPYFPDLKAAFTSKAHPHIHRMRPRWISCSALVRRAHGSRTVNTNTWQDTSLAFPQGQTTGMALLLVDPRRHDDSASLAYLFSQPDPETLEDLLGYTVEVLAEEGINRLIGPTGFSPYISSGLLCDSWDQLPPLYTLYNEPYLPETVAEVMQGIAETRLYQLELPATLPSQPDSRARLSQLVPDRLAASLLPLFQAAVPVNREFPDMDGKEASFVLESTSRWPRQGWLAEVEGEPAGFILLQSNLASQMRLAGGGRSRLWRFWLDHAGRRPVRSGRVLFGAVLPRYRRHGIGRLLLWQALFAARLQGWENLDIGPLDPHSEGAAFLQACGARPRQTYRLFAWH